MSQIFDDDGGDDLSPTRALVGALGHGDIVRCLDEADDGLLILDDDGYIRYANELARSTLAGSAGADVIGQHFGRPLETREGDRLELVTSYGQTRTVDIHATRVTDPRLAGWVLVLRDVQDDADGLALAYHELRNTLTTMVAAVETLQDDWDDVPTARRHDYFQLLQRKIGRMSRTIDGYLSAARAHVGALEPRGDRIDLLVTAADYLQNAGLRRDQVEIDVPHGLMVWINPDHLHAILDNLVTNALKYADTLIDIRGEVEGTHVHLDVQDRGPGVPAHLRDRLFERFSRDDAQTAVAGSGLGLWVARSLAEAYGAHLRYHDRAGGGACFRLSLPMIETEP